MPFGLGRRKREGHGKGERRERRRHPACGQSVAIYDRQNESDPIRYYPHNPCDSLTQEIPIIKADTPDDER